MSEECSNANIAGEYHMSKRSNSTTDVLGPRAIVMTAVGGLVGGWATILVIVYTVKDIPVSHFESCDFLY